MEQEDIKPDLGVEVPAVVKEFPPGMAPKMLNMVKNLNDLKELVDPLIAEPYYEVLNKLSPLEKAKVGVMENYSINTLFWVLMKTSGEGGNETMLGDWKIEMGRLKEAQSRLSEVEARAHRTRVDKAAATRFIEHGLGVKKKKQKTDNGTES